MKFWIFQQMLLLTPKCLKTINAVLKTLQMKIIETIYEMHIIKANMPHFEAVSDINNIYKRIFIISLNVLQILHCYKH